MECNARVQAVETAFRKFDAVLVTKQAVEREREGEAQKRGQTGVRGIQLIIFSKRTRGFLGRKGGKRGQV
jgi:hypothetical protein